MAARTQKIRHDENTRKKIQASQLIKVLTEHVLGEREMSSTQVTAALGLMKKILPDLSNIDIDATVDQTIKDVTADPLTPEEWSAQYAGDDSGD